MDLFSDSDNPPSPFIVSGDLQAECRYDPTLGFFNLSVPHGELLFAPHFFDQPVSDRMVDYLTANDGPDSAAADGRGLNEAALAQLRFTNIRWQQDYLQMYGKRIALPRLTAWYGDEGCSYRYSGITYDPNPWNEGLGFIKREVEAAAGAPFNSVLLNWYRHGKDQMGWHADDEPELGKNPLIASVNFGETRDFILRRNDDQRCKIKLALGHGALLIMKGSLQHFWQHAVPRRVRATGSRFNLTFRHIVT